MRQKASRILVASAATGEMSPADKTYLGQQIAARAGLPETDATARVNTMLAQVNEAKAKAQEATDKGGIAFALIAALSLVIGAFIAYAAAALGGRLRDE